MSLLLVPVVVAFGLHPATVAFYEFAEALASLLTHMNIRTPQRLDRILGWVFVTPRLHRLHHSAEQVETDSNYGTMFSVWDRLFGTFRASALRPAEPIHFGLHEIDAEGSVDLTRQLVLPWASKP